jgi:origin recognition complex subunit 5
LLAALAPPPTTGPATAAAVAGVRGAERPPPLQQQPPPPASAAALVRALDAEAAAPAPAAGVPRIVLVLYHADRLRAQHVSADLLRVLLRLPLLLLRSAPDSVRVVFVSRVPWAAFRDARVEDAREPLCVHFPAYAEDQVMAVVRDMTIAVLPSLVLDTDRLANPDDLHRLYPGFVTYIVQVLYAYTTDVNEIASVCERLYPAYLAPLIRDPTVPIASLCSRIEGELALAIRTLYSREHAFSAMAQDKALTSRSPEMTDGEQDLVPANDVPPAQRQLTSAPPMVDTMGLSRSSKFLLIAAFLAASNPPKLDLHYFSSQLVRRRKRVRKDSKRHKNAISKHYRRASLSAVGLPLNRIIAIFDAIQGVGSDLADAPAIVPDKLTNREFETSIKTLMSTAAFVNLSNLVSLQLLDRDGGGDLISDPKFRCNITPETAAAISDSINFQLGEYLHTDMREE